jgi:hypothetical protein
MPISRQQLVNELLPALDKLFNGEPNRTEYHMKRRYGRCTIYRWDFVNGKRTSMTLAKGLSHEEATNMMKLLKDPA